MTELTLQTHRRVAWYFIPGLALGAVIAGVALWGGSIPAVMDAGSSVLTLTTLSGTVLGNTIYPRIWKSCDGGVPFIKQHLLHLEIIPYGFHLTFAQIVDVGVSNIVIDMLTLSNTFLIACFLGQKVFSLDRHTNWLIGAGSGVCRTTAVLATEPVMKVEASKVTIAAATVVIFSIIATFLYPTMYPLLVHWFSPEAYGIYTGSAMHEVAQVAVAGHAINPDAENAAVTTKMLRVMMLAPFLILLVACAKQLSPTTGGEKSKATIPWFATPFTAVVTFNSFHLLSQSVANTLVTLDTILLAMATVTLGLTTYISALKKAGAKSLLMAPLLFVWLIVGGGTIDVVVHALMA